MRFDRITCKVDALPGKPRLQPLLQDIPESFYTDLQSLDDSMKMRIIYRHYPHPHPGNLRTNRHAVPSIQLIFIRIERNICQGAVRIDMPHVFNHFVLHTLLLPARYCDLSVFAKRETDKKEKPVPEAYNAVLGETVSTKIKENHVKRQMGKRCRIRSGTHSPSYDTNRGRPLFGNRGPPRCIA